MATIKTPGAGVSPYETTTTAPTVLRASADGTTTLAAAATDAIGANTSVYVTGQAALNSLITTSQPGVFQGANVTINLEEQNFNTTNQVTATTNYPSGNTGEIQYNSGANSFASDPYFTYTNSNVVTPGIRTDGYYYANGSPFSGGGGNGNVSIATNSTPGIMALGNGFSLNSSNQVSTANLYSTNLSEPTQHYGFSLDTNGVLHLPDQSIINGSTLRGVPGTGELNYTGITIGPNSGNAENTWMWVDASNAYIATDYSNVGKTWTFDSTGNITLPGIYGAQLIVNQLGGPGLFTGGATAQPSLNYGVRSNVFVGDDIVFITDSGNSTWTFGTDGSLQVPSNATAAGPGTIASANGYPTLLAYGTGGGFGIHGGPELDWMNADDPANNFSNVNTLRNTAFLNATGFYIGMNENSVVGNTVASWRFTPDGNLTLPSGGQLGYAGMGWTGLKSANGTPIEIDSYYANGNISGQIYMTPNGNLSLIGFVEGGASNAWSFNSDASVLFPYQPTNNRTGSGEALVFAKSNNQKVIATAPGDAGQPIVSRLVIAGGDGFESGEGGDIYLWAGRSGVGVAGGSGGGDIKVDAGEALNSAQGGTVKIRAGNSYDQGIGGGIGGFVEILAGGGNTGGPVTISSGQGNSQANSGFVQIQTPYGGTWYFDNYGNLTTPGASGNITGADVITANVFAMTLGGNITEGNIPAYTSLTGNTIVLTPSGGTSADQQLVIYPTVTPGADANHLHLTSGNLYNTELFLGDDFLYVKLANTGNVVINSNNLVGNSAQWTFDTSGMLIFPTGNLIITPEYAAFGNAAVISSADHNLVTGSFGANGGTSSLWVEDYANIGSSNIAAVYANPVPGSGNVRIAVGTNGGPGPYLWDFQPNGNLTAPGNISTTGNITGAYFSGNGSGLTDVTATVPSQTILPTVQTITAIPMLTGYLSGGEGGVTVTVANTIPVTEFGVIVTAGTVSQKYATGSLGNAPGTGNITFTTGTSDQPFTVYAYITSNAGTYYSNAVTGTSGMCSLAGTQIALSDGSHKAIEDITLSLIHI